MMVCDGECAQLKCRVSRVSNIVHTNGSWHIAIIVNRGRSTVASATDYMDNNLMFYEDRGIVDELHSDLDIVVTKVGKTWYIS